MQAGRRAAAATPAALLAELGAELRREGVAVGSGELIAAYRSLLLLDLADPVEVADGVRACLTRSPEDREAFDRIVAAWLVVRDDGGEEEPPPSHRREASSPAPAAEEDADQELVDAGAWSAHRRLRTLDFAEMNAEERRRAERLVEELGRIPPLRPSRRPVDAKRPGRLDLGATLRRSRRFDHDPAELVWRRRKPAPVPINLILDVSASMEPYALMLLHYLRASVVAQRASEAFVFGTEARRVTPLLRTGTTAEPLAALLGEEMEWGGGTKIGAALGEINRGLGHAFRRGGITVIASDGWDRGDLVRLEREMRILRQRSRAVIWLSPHSERPGFEPLVGGLRTALPFVDALLSAESVDALSRFATVVGRVARQRERAVAVATPVSAPAGGS